MEQQGSAAPELPAWRGKARLWLRSIAACGLALTLGLGQAYAGTIANAHEGGQGQDKEKAAIASARASGDDGGVEPKAIVEVDVVEEGIGTNAWTRTVTRTVTGSRFVSSVTRSTSLALDEEGNKAIARAVARARAPNSAAAVQRGAGNIVAKTSVDVTGNGRASADAGGSIGVRGRKVEVSTWGKTSAEVF